MSVFSPPESSEMLQASLPGGRGDDLDAASSTSSASSSRMSASPPPNSRRKSSRKWPRTVSSVARKSCRLSTLIRWMMRSSAALASTRSRYCSERPPKRASRSSSSSRESRFTEPSWASWSRSWVISRSDIVAFTEFPAR